MTLEQQSVETWQSVRPYISKQALAEKLGIRQPSVSNWKRIPDHHVEDVSRILYIPRETLRPDLYAAEQSVPSDSNQMSAFDSHS